MSDFTMPSLGADMESGKLVEWLVKPGDTVSKGQVIAVVETHKGAIEAEIFEEGTVAELCASEGDTVPVGEVLARIDGEKAGEPAAAAAQPAKAVPDREQSTPASTSSRPPPPSAPRFERGGRTKVSPAARKRAAELGIDAESLKGTGIGGAVTFADVEFARSRKAAPARKPEAAPGRKGGFDPAEMRSAIAAAMARSKREIPHYYLASTVDLQPALDWLSVANEGRPPAERMLPAVLLLKASALALQKLPQLNGFWQDDASSPGEGIHVGWAVSLRGGGLVSPAIHHADRLALPELMDKLRDVVARARSGGLRSSELMDPTVTLTSLGERGADQVFGVIYPPQVAIIGFGRIRERPWAVEGEVVARPLVDVTLAADHRASDGHAGGRLLSTIDQLLQEPEKL